jgi:hypothetical protein
MRIEGQGFSMGVMRERRFLFVLPIAALLAVLPLVLHGDSCGDDFAFHIFNWMEVGSQWKQGVLLPHWEFTAAWNSGEPRFVFYPPISWALGALLGLILPWAATSVTLIWLALTACALSMYRLAREWTKEGVAILAACLYMVHPYMLFTFYQRSAYAELIAAALMPLLLLGVLRERITIAGIAVPVALLWLTNDPAAVMGIYTVAMLGTLRLIWMCASTRRRATAMGDAARMAAGTLLGMALAAFTLLPAVVEQHWVQIRMIMIEGVRVQDNFLFDHSISANHRAVVRTPSITSVWLLGLIAFFGLIAVLVERRRNREDSRMFPVVALLAVAAVLGFLLTSASLPVWTYAPELKYLQFPWRFNAVLGAIAVALLALALNRVKLWFPLAVTVALAASLLLSMKGYKRYHQWCNRGNDVASLASDFYRGANFDDYDSYLPVGADHFAMAHDNPESWIAARPTEAAPVNAPHHYSIALKDRLHFTVNSPNPAYFVINLRDYPAWRITLNGVSVKDHPHRADGLIVVPVAQGTSQIDIADAVTWDRVAGWPVSALALGILVALKGRARSARNPTQPLSPWAANSFRAAQANSAGQ